MKMLSMTVKGSFNNTNDFFNRMKSKQMYKCFKKYALKGVSALSSATPVDTGLTATSWKYTIEITDTEATITWTNSNIVDGVPVALILQYGHVTATGGWVQGIDYINPALGPVFNKILKEVWKEVTK